MARAALRMTVRQLAEAAGVGISTVQRIEQDDGVPSASAKNVSAIAQALQAAGVQFPDDKTVRVDSPAP